MHRTDDDGNVAGLFSAGVVGVTPATQVSDVWLNAMQEGIAQFIEAEGIVLSKGNNAQLTLAVVTAIAYREAAHLPALLNSWVDNGGGSLRSAAYFKTQDGHRHLQGSLSDNAGAAVTGSVAFNLPVGYRPAKDVLFPVVKVNIGAGLVASVTVKANGDVQIDWSGGGVIGTLSLDGLNFGP